MGPASPSGPHINARPNTHTYTKKRGGKASGLGCGPTQVSVIFVQHYKVAKVSAEDADAPSSPNSHVVHQLLSFLEPEEPAELRAFELTPRGA